MFPQALAKPAEVEWALVLVEKGTAEEQRWVAVVSVEAWAEKGEVLVVLVVKVTALLVDIWPLAAWSVTTPLAATWPSPMGICLLPQTPEVLQLWARAVILDVLVKSAVRGPGNPIQSLQCFLTENSS